MLAGVGLIPSGCTGRATALSGLLAVHPPPASCSANCSGGPIHRVRRGNCCSQYALLRYQSRARADRRRGLHPSRTSGAQCRLRCRLYVATWVSALQGSSKQSQIFERDPVLRLVPRPAPIHGEDLARRRALLCRRLASQRPSVPAAPRMICSRTYAAGDSTCQAQGRESAIPLSPEHVERPGCTATDGEPLCRYGAQALAHAPICGLAASAALFVCRSYCSCGDGSCPGACCDCPSPPPRV